MSFQDRAAQMTQPGSQTPRPAAKPGRTPDAAPRAAPPEIIESIFEFLSHALPRYAVASTFVGALDEAREFALRDVGDAATAFRHFDGRLSGILEAKRAKLRVAGLSAAQIMEDVVGTYCTDPEGAPRRAEIAAGARIVHVAATRLSGDRLVRHACYDTVMTDRFTGQRVSAATLLLRPLDPPTLVLRRDLRIAGAAHPR